MPLPEWELFRAAIREHLKTFSETNMKFYFYPKLADNDPYKLNDKEIFLPLHVN